MTAVPIASRVPGGKLSSLRSKSIYNWSPASGQRFIRVSHERNRSGVHDIDLVFTVRFAIGSALATLCAPRVADEAFIEIELSFVQDLALVHIRPPYNQLQHAVIFRRLLDVLQAGFKLVDRQVRRRFHLL